MFLLQTLFKKKRFTKNVLLSSLTGSGSASLEEADLKIKKLFEWCSFAAHNGEG